MRIRIAALGTALLASAAFAIIPAGIASAASPADVGADISSVNDATVSVADWDTAIHDFQGSVAQADKVLDAARALDTHLKSDTATVQSTGRLTVDASAAVVAASAKFSAKMEDSLSALAQKRDKFKPLGLNGIVKSTVTDLQKNTDAFSGALGSNVSAKDEVTVQVETRSIDSGFQKALAGF